MSETKKKSTKVAIETAETGWIVRVQGVGVPRIFVRWEALVSFIRFTAARIAGHSSGSILISFASRLSSCLITTKRPPLSSSRPTVVAASS